MYRITRIGVVVFALLGFTALSALAQETVAIGKKGEVYFASETRVGVTLLKPGHYQFQHRIVDAQHYLVVRERQPLPVGAGTHAVGGGGGRELLRVPCRVIPTADGAKTSATALYRKRDPDGIGRVTRIDIADERQGHRITLEPES